MLEVRLLGTFEVKHGRKAINIASRPAQSLFAYLILSAGTSHRREKLAGLLWPDSLEETARDNLRHALWRIRKALTSGPKVEYLLVDDLSIAFNAAAEYWLDASALEKVGEDASSDELISVLSAYQGELLPGFYDEWAILEREHLNSIFEHKMARLLSLLQKEKRWLDILEWGERWIKLGQKPEPAYRALMSAHAAKGDMSKVAATYERCVKSLKEFGVEPSEQTKELYKSLKSSSPAPTRAIKSHVPSGTVTFLFTDIEGSSRLAQAHPKEWEALLGRHHAILRESIESNNGYLFQLVGDGFCAAFHTPKDGLHAAVQAQQKLQTEDWGADPIKVRMGIHTGEAEAHDHEYRGYFTLSLVQRLTSTGHGGQILLSHSTENLLRGHLPEDVSLLDLGEHKFKDILQPVRVFQVVAPELQKEFPALRALNVFPNNLPIQLTSFIGREKEIEEIVRLLGEHRLVTLTGPGGVGKTRLAIQSSNKLLSKFKDGVWWVELAPLTEAAFVPQAVAQTLGMRDSSSQPLMESLKNFLREKQLLLVLDNCEHLIVPSAQLAFDLLSHCANLRILTTSREALGITGEIVYSVPTLSFPKIKSLTLTDLLLEYESIRLFVERASAVKSEFVLTDQNAAAVVQICQRLDGISLALELAAARIKLLSVEEIADRLNDRFNLLTQGSRTALPRHQTLRAAIDWSHNLLTEPEQILFRRLAVFAGGFTLEAVESVVGGDVSPQVQVPDLLEQLIDKSLVMVRAGSEDSETRYSMLETIRQYAREKLSDTEEASSIHDRHLAYFAKLAEQAGPELRGQNQIDWLRRLETLQENFRAALEWAIQTQQTKAALEMARKLHWFWFVRSEHTEARRWFERILTMANVSEYAEFHSEVLTQFAHHIGDQTERPKEIRPLVEQALSIARAHTDKRNIGRALSILGLILTGERQFAMAQSALEESMQLFQELHDDWEFARAVMGLAKKSYRQDELATSFTLYEQALALFQKIGDRYFQSFAIYWIGVIGAKQGNVKSGKAALREALMLAQQLDSKYAIGSALWRLSEITQIDGDSESTVRLYWAAKNIWNSIGTLTEDDERDFEKTMASCRAALGDSAFKKAVQVGRSLTIEQAIGYALQME